MAIATGDTFQWRPEAVAGDQQILNIWGLVATADGPSYTPAQTVQMINTVLIPLWRSSIVPYLADKYEAIRYFAGYIGPFNPAIPGSWQYQAVDYKPGGLASDVGGVSTDAVESFGALSVQLKTAQPGKIGRGSKRLGPIPESSTEFNTITPTALGAYDTAVDDFLNGANAGFVTNDYPLAMAVLSFKKYSTVGGGAWGFLITDSIVNSFVGSQLSRKSYLRGH